MKLTFQFKTIYKAMVVRELCMFVSIKKLTDTNYEYVLDLNNNRIGSPYRDFKIKKVG